MNFKREIIAPFRYYEFLKRRYPRRRVIPEAMCPDYEFAYFGRGGRVRMVRLPDFDIWECDWDRGFPFMKCIRRKTPAHP